MDWGTTNRRAYSIDGAGRVIATERDDQGLLAVSKGGFANSATAIRALFGDLPMLCAGMVGSVKGWAEVPYQRCPVDLESLAANLLWVEPGRTALVPGVCTIADGVGDIMRGEEVQLLGAVAAGLAPADALLCQPGTHCKWARMTDSRLAGFRTGMTGEIFALLRKHSLLADFLDGDVRDGDAFRDGVALAQKGALLGPLFAERASALLGIRAREEIAAHVSGLLIGSDVREQALEPGSCVHILADPALGCLYAAAIDQLGGRSVPIDSHAAFVAGITHIWRMIRADAS
ncbi:2-dehydro-3-deoxygalactonokinase [Stakelama sediminis]|uniref:2-dehydro-3-deoxygalactonokinase n=1 Tax=Stakelama sediminis TaxID=463200 RepID=A0A840Z060_9SPHN|nr:2-dehydro-3-deoxygalactonokinase [Stakelama sediminis]